GKSTQFGQGHAVINSVSNVKLNLDTSLIQANLSWDTSGIWTNGAIFIITRLNRTNNTSTTIQLGKDEYYAGKYTDSFITSCNEYYYTLQVKPADNLGFIAEKPYQTINSVVPTNIGNVTGFTASKGYFPDRTELR